MPPIKRLVAQLAFVLLCYGSLNAQNEKPAPSIKVPVMLQNADYVFEGTAIDATGYWTTIENGNRVIYTSLLVQISNVFKGVGMKKGLVQVIVRGGSASLESDSQFIAITDFNNKDAVQIPYFRTVGSHGIIIGKVAPQNRGYKWNKSIENTIIIEQQRAIIFCEDCDNYRYFAPWAGDFPNAKELRKNIKSFKLTTDFIDRSDIVEDSIAKIQQ